ncbi:hypothetical protein [Bacillus sp. 165]|uniref:Cas10/Cmr2 second palm domain-containing protein n=1 Tax=Bacillus sp. 165 TaxID=1529117 RepID=UPI001AD9DC2A|nr:hypothetical protein [Bacillus sp. 165]MBO9129086.1 hypothetical protein [Bacillus sp. 165]
MEEKKEFKYLLLLDTDKIKEYVFASSKLKEIRGASMLLEYLNTVESRKIIYRQFNLEDTYDKDEHEQFRILYLDGGSGKVEFNSEIDAKKCGKKIEETYKKWTQSASVTWEVVKVNNDNYYETVANGEFRVRVKKQKSKWGNSQQRNLGITKRCSHCNSGDAENLEFILSNDFLPDEIKEQSLKTYKSLKNIYGEEYLICRACYLKNVILKHKTNKLLTRKIEKMYYQSGKIDWPNKLSVIGEHSNGEIGFLYFDGNNMNSILRELKQVKDFKEFSQNLKKSIEKALLETINEVFPYKSLKYTSEFQDNEDEQEIIQGEKEKRVLPFQVILAAGDDLMLIVPSINAMDIATIFQRKFAIAHDGKLTMSVGVAIAKSSFPIKYLAPFSEQLLRSAKSKNYEIKRENRLASWEELSTIDFMVLKMNSNPELISIRTSQLTKKNDVNEEYYLTLRPYTYSQWNAIKDILLKMKYDKEAFPKSKMKSFYALHFMEHWEGRYYFGKYFANLPENQRENLKALYQLFPKNSVQDCHWFKDKNKYYSPLIDVFEIFPYIEGGVKI